MHERGDVTNHPTRCATHRHIFQPLAQKILQNAHWDIFGIVVLSAGSRDRGKRLMLNQFLTLLNELACTYELIFLVISTDHICSVRRGHSIAPNAKAIRRHFFWYAFVNVRYICHRDVFARLRGPAIIPAMSQQFPNWVCALNLTAIMSTTDRPIILVACLTGSFSGTI